MMHMVGGNSLLCHVDAFIKLGKTVTMYSVICIRWVTFELEGGGVNLLS